MRLLILCAFFPAIHGPHTYAGLLPCCRGGSATTLHTPHRVWLAATGALVEAERLAAAAGRAAQDPNFREPRCLETQVARGKPRYKLGPSGHSPDQLRTEVQGRESAPIGHQLQMYPTCARPFQQNRKPQPPLALQLQRASDVRTKPGAEVAQPNG